jgi:hypothetical protein
MTSFGTSLLIVCTLIRPACADIGTYDPEGIANFRNYIHGHMQDPKLTNRLRSQSNELKVSPFIYGERDPQIIELATRMLEEWSPPGCSQKVPKDAPKLTVIGERHDCPNCNLTHERNVRAALRKDIFFALEGELFDEGESTEIRNAYNAFYPEKSLLKVSSQWEDTPLFGIENFKIYFLNLTLSYLSESAEAAEADPNILKLPLKSSSKKIQSRAQSLFIRLVLTEESPALNELLTRLSKSAALDISVKKIKSLRETYTGKMLKGELNDDQIDAFLMKLGETFTVGELKNFFKAMALEYIDIKKTDLFDDLLIPLPMKIEILSTVADKLKKDYFPQAFTLISIATRSLIFAQNTLQLYCLKSMKNNSQPLIVQMGDVHAWALEYLFKKKLPDLNVDIRHEFFKYLDATEKSTLNNLEKFLKGD